MKREYRLDCVKVVERKPDDPLYIRIKEYTPHSCPWDYYGMLWTMEMGKVMRNADIPHELCETSNEHLCPQGTGPGGRVRFGDSMMPSHYILWVPKHREVDAEKALEAHRLAVENWIHNNGPMPEACKR